jgi:ribonucleoside-diphosphate reductase alpha chain
VVDGRTYKIRWSEHAVYVTINDIIEDGVRRPFEIFINSKNVEHHAWTVALTRMISAIFRRGGPIDFVAEELRAVFDPRGGEWMGGRYVPSLLAAIGDLVARHIRGEEGMTEVPANKHPAASVLRQCPKCGGLSLLRSEGCDRCTVCDYSRC